jgi:hypothetical protein
LWTVMEDLVADVPSRENKLKQRKPRGGRIVHGPRPKTETRGLGRMCGCEKMDVEGRVRDTCRRPRTETVGSLAVHHAFLL